MFHLRSFHACTIHTLLLFTLATLNGSSAAFARGGDPPAQKSVSTGLSGFYDYQTVGASPLLIAANPANPLHLHAVCTQSFDSLNVQGSRRVGYAYSSDGGLSWQKVSSLGGGGAEVFPSLSLLPNGAAAVACEAGVPAQTKIFLDAGEGAKLFAPLATVPTGADDPLMPMLAAMTTSDLQVIASRPAERSVHIATLDYLTFGAVSRSVSMLAKPQRLAVTPIPWGQSLTGPGGETLIGDCHTIARSADGYKVALVHRGSVAAEGASVCYAESVDSGKTFGAFQNIMPFPFVIGADTLAARGGLDAAYNGDELQIVFGAAKFTNGIYTEPQASIFHWSAASGLKKMIDGAAMQTAFGGSFSGVMNKPQTNTFPVDYPSVGSSDDGTVFVAFQAASPRLSAAGFNYFNVYLVSSTNGGLSWSPPIALEAASERDFRYPSVSKFNPASAARQVALVYQSDGEPASSVMDAAPVSHAELRFRAVQQSELTLSTPPPPPRTPAGFVLSQNYPNPFNPNTVVSYRLSAFGQVSLKVFDVLGREVKTLVNAEQAAGNYSVSFNAAGLPSGVYFYRLRAGGGQSSNFTETKKMLLAK